MAKKFEVEIQINGAPIFLVSGPMLLDMLQLKGCGVGVEVGKSDLVQFIARNEVLTIQTFYAGEEMHPDGEDDS